mmetsp:Transcript_10742/g.27015  ORF Transcript_10742/g.27015 Transcript_10742/m.27015 type:complete len:213 (-) Transcript_10742:455-1093(-)
MHQQFHQPLAHLNLDDGLDPVVGAVGEVAQRPEGVREHVLVRARHQLRENGQGGLHLLKSRLGLAPAVVGKGPGGVPEHGDLGGRVELREQRLHGALVQDQVPALGRVSRNVAEGPDGLLPHILRRGGQEVHKDGHGALLDDDLGVLARPARDVGQRPRRLELELGNVVPLKKLDELSHHVCLDHLRDWGVSLYTQQLSEPHRRLQLVLAHV